MEAIGNYFQVQPGVETTFEVNPDDMNEMTVPFWRQQGINRLSIGIQSFRDQDLQWMNRVHNAEQARTGIELAKKEGFGNYSIDLIYGVPGMDDEAWKSNLQMAIELGVPHISAYALTVEPRPALNTMIDQGKKKPVDNEDQARQFLIAMEMLESAGYEHYEISNFAKPGMRSQHNSSYWEGIPYFGFGPGAHSFDGYTRYWNMSNNARYINSINQGIIPFDKEDLTETQMLNEYIMTSLRTMEGLDLGRIVSKWGPEKAEIIVRESKKHIDNGLIRTESDHLSLTKKGKALCRWYRCRSIFCRPCSNNQDTHLHWQRE
jgi:oxygen-independent coproporphyrinogen-3 oxidase